MLNEFLNDITALRARRRLMGACSGIDRFLNTALWEGRQRPDAIPTLAQRWAARVARPSRVMLAAAASRAAGQAMVAGVVSAVWASVVSSSVSPAAQAVAARAAARAACAGWFGSR